MMISSEFQIQTINIEDFKLISEGESENCKPITRNVLEYDQDVKFPILES